MTTEEKFRAAVNVIRNLPKNGSYQPSHEMMLRFYAYFKQATEGPCTAPRPAFWEVVKKMKWDAWSKLGNMSKEEAMNNYVEELKKIVETMSYSDNVANFLGSLGSFYDAVPVEDLELLVGNVIERMRSEPGSPLTGSPFASREASPTRVEVTTNGHHFGSSLETSPASSYSASPQLGDLEEEEEEEFIDTVEAEPEHNTREGVHKVTIKSPPVSNDFVNGTESLYTDQTTDNLNGCRLKSSSLKGKHNHEQMEGTLHISRPHQERGRLRERNNSRIKLQGGEQCSTETAEETLQLLLEPLEVTEKLRKVVNQLQTDLTHINDRMDNLERALSIMKAEDRHRDPKWWPFRQVPPGFAVFVVLWPIVFHLSLKWLQRRQQKRLM